MNDKSWLREPSVYEQVIAEGGLSEVGVSDAQADLGWT